MGNLGHVGREKETLDGEIDHQEDAHRPTRHPSLHQVAGEHEGGDDHGQGDGQTVGCLHVGRGLEHEHRDDTQHVEHVVDDGDVDLALVGRRVLEAQHRPEVEVNGLAEDGEAAADEGLAGNDGRTGGHDHTEEQHPLGHDGIEGVDGCAEHAAVADDIGALPHVVENEHELDERPAGGDVLATAVAQVGVEGLGTRGAEKDGTQHQEPLGVVHQQQHGIIGVEGLEYHWGLHHVAHAEHAEHEKPQQHERSEITAYRARAEALDEEYRRDHCQHDGYDGDMWRESVQALDSRGDGDGRGDNSVGNECAGTYDGQHVVPSLAPLADEGVEGQDAALALVVGTQRHQHILDGGLQGERPDDARHGTQDIVGVERWVGTQNGVHDVERRGADVAKDDAYGHEHAKPAQCLGLV